MIARAFTATAGALALLALAPAPSSAQDSQGAQAPPQQPSGRQSETDWGIRVESLRLSAGGHMIDFRYRVLDPEKAASLGKRENKACLIDEASGQKLLVPNTPKVGPLRQTAQRLIAGRVYWMLFSNAGGLVKPGSRVTVAIGDWRAEGLEVR